VWQEKITFDAIFAMVGGADLYLKVYRDRDQKAVMSPQFKQVLVEFKKLKGFVDAGSPGRNWNDATAMVVQGKGRRADHGRLGQGRICRRQAGGGQGLRLLPGFGPKAPYIVAGDAFVFPKTNDANAVKAQKLWPMW
jgi:glucose/mannose transport system substrate-binding protein